jgi:hypothetical protein
MRVDFHQGFLNNKRMTLLFCATHFLSNDYREELTELLFDDLNIQNPVVFDLRSLSIDDQKKAIVLIEEFFLTKNLSYNFPYPIYALSGYKDESSGLTSLRSEREIPLFFTKISGKMNLKENHLKEKNALIQRQIKNSDHDRCSEVLKDYSYTHKKIYLEEQERLFYKSILLSLEKERK